MSEQGRLNGLRIAVAGASGTLGREFLDVLGADRFPVAELLPFATDGSTGADVELLGEDYAVAGERPRFEGLDAVVLCTPAEVSRELARDALRASVPCIDASGAFLGTPEVTVGVVGGRPDAAIRTAPLICAPPGSTLSCARVVAAMAGSDEIEGVNATVLASASDLGRRGIEALSSQTIALLNQSGEEDEAEDDELKGLAFDCRAASSPHEGSVALGAVLEHLRGAPVPTTVTRVRVPIFIGEGVVLRLDFAHAPDLEAVSKRVAAAAGIDLWDHGETPSTREAAGREDVLVSPPTLESDRSGTGHAVSLWATADPVRLAARNLADLLRVRLLPPDA